MVLCSENISGGPLISAGPLFSAPGLQIQIPDSRFFQYKVPGRAGLTACRCAWKKNYNFCHTRSFSLFRPVLERSR